jgi:serine/threonine protein phosphatase PrpC
MAENYFGITDTGKVRGNNEDTFIAETVMNGQFVAACVIDGVGGYSGGEVASRLARHAILQQLSEPKADVILSMKEALAAANEAIYRERQLNKQNEQMACVVTLALVDIPQNKFYYAHVGDTRLYLFRDNTLVKISHDHSFVGFLEDSGRISETEAMNHPKRNEINKALGFDGSINTEDYIETGESPFLPGDVLLLCSDGLSDMIDRNAMVTVLNAKKTLSAKGKILIKDANDAGGKDNITVVLVHNDKSATKHTALKPAAVAAVKSDELIKDELIDSKYVETEKVIVQERKKSSGAVSILSVLCFLLLAAVVWLFYQYYQNKGKAQSIEPVAMGIQKKRNEQEQALADSINRPGKNEVFVLNTAGSQPITITDSITINKDTLRIIGNGVTLVNDSTHKGPLFNISHNAKYVLLDSLTLENFDIAILVQNNALHFRKVSFKNCRIPVQYNFTYPENTVVSGGLVEPTTGGMDTLTLPK